MYVIKNQVMATYLMSRGFRLMKLDEDKVNSNRNIYLFNDSKGLREAMSEYQRNNKGIII